MNQGQPPNHSIEPTQASRSAQSQIVGQRRLAWAGHGGRSALKSKP
jgi:hypothetical protein